MNVLHISTFLLLLFLIQSCASDEPRNESDHEPIKFSGKNKFIQFNTSGIPLSTFSYEFWVKTTQEHEVDTEDAFRGVNGTKGQQFVVFPGHSLSTTARGTGISIGTNGVTLYEHKSEYLNARIVHEARLIGWNHIAVCYNMDSPQLFVNGVLVGIRKATPDKVLPVFTIGKKYHENLEFLGSVDEFRIWSIALQEEDILERMNSSLIGDEDGLELYYILRSPDNATIFSDISGHGRHGQVVHGKSLIE